MIRRDDPVDGVVVLRLEHGRANAIDRELADELADRMRELGAGDPAPAVILTGSGPIFSAGVDLFRLLEEDESYVDGFLPALRRMLLGVATYPRPVVAALNGHAVAGGCILALACDLRLMAEGVGTVGVPELRVGVPFPGLALRILRAAVPSARLRPLVYGGRTYGPREAHGLGLVDEVVEPERLLARAVEAAAELAAIPAEAFALTKRQLAATEPGERDEGGDADEVERSVLRSWRSAEAREAIRAYLERTLGRTRR